jgi:hypothetical protein
MCKNSFLFYNIDNRFSKKNIFVVAFRLDFAGPISMHQPTFFYKAFGLTFSSCIEHPEFTAIDEIARPDCTINFGPVPQRLSDPDATGVIHQVHGGCFLLRIANVGRYLVENGNSITIDKAPGASERETLIFLWASAIAALLHQRGIMIVHGSAIKTNESAVIFSGRSGSGKSTLASAFAEAKDALIISDDICAISINENGIPMVLPGYPLVKLWRDSSEKVGLDWDDSRLIRESVNKMMINVSDRFVDFAVPLRQFYLLSYKNSGPATLNEINGYKKLDILLGKIFRKNYLKKNELWQEDIFRDAAKILSQIRLSALERQHGMAFLDETLDLLVQDLKQSATTLN